LKPLNENRAVRLLHFLADGVLRHPLWFWCTQLLLVLVCLGYTIKRLQFSTDRNDLISVRESYRQQFLQFKKQFQIHDNLFVLVESGSQEKNREFVERLAARLQLDGQFSEIFYRGGVKLMGPKALLFLPEESLAELQQIIRTNQPLLQNLSQVTNLDTLFSLVNRQFRRLAATPSEGSPDRVLSQSLPALQRVVDQVSDYLESPEIPIAPNIMSLLGGSQQESLHELYLTFDHGRIYALIAQAKNPSQEQAAIRQLRKRIAQTRTEVPGVNVDVTGEAVLRFDEMQQARRDTELAALISLGLTALIIIGSCREILRPLMATFCLLMGIGYTLGFATLTVGRLNILSITLVPILIGLAIDYGVHLIFRYEEELRLGHTRRLAIRKAVGLTGMGVISSAFTIAGAFYFMVLTDFKGMQEMGLIAGSGVLVCLVPMLTLLPLLLVRGKPDLADPRAWRGTPSQRARLITNLQCPDHDQQTRQRKQRQQARIEQLFLKHPWVVLACGAAFTWFTIIGIFRVGFDYNLLNLQSQGLPAVRMQKKLIQAGSQSLLYCAVIADSLPQAVAWEQRINQLPSVARVISLVKYLTEDQERKLILIREIKQELGTIPFAGLDRHQVNLARLNQTLFSLHSYLDRVLKFVQPSGSNQSLLERLDSLLNSVIRLQRLTALELPSVAHRLTAYQQSLFGGLHETVGLIEQQEDRQRLQPKDIPAFLRDIFISHSGKYLLQVYPKEDVWQRVNQERFIRELRTVDPAVTGSPVQFYEYTTRLKLNVETAAVYAAGIIAVLVFVHFRRVSSVLLALLPVVLGFCWMLGLMGWLGITFNPVNIVSLILLIGIGVTNGVHILNRFAEDPHPNILARSTGKAVLVSALNTIAGFGSLMVAKHEGIASLGAVMALGTCMCMVASLAFLPAVLKLLCRIGWRPTDLPKEKQ
jgi:uncharacterized protein